MAALDRLQRAGHRTRGAAPAAAAAPRCCVYYSGHADEQGLLLGDDRYSYRTLRDRLDEIPADVRIAVLDACASGAFTRIKSGKPRPAFLVDESADMRGHAFLTSSAATEAAQESDRIRASYFTHYLVSGFRGAADLSGDGKVTLNEAYQFAFTETLGRTVDTKGGAQHPSYDISLSGTGDVVMTDLRQTTATLVLAEELDGRFFVRNGGAASWSWSSTSRAAGAWSWASSPGPTRFALELQRASLMAKTHLADGARVVLDAAQFTATTRRRRGAAADRRPRRSRSPAATGSSCASACDAVGTSSGRRGHRRRFRRRPVADMTLHALFPGGNRHDVRHRKARGRGRERGLRPFGCFARSSGVLRAGSAMEPAGSGTRSWSPTSPLSAGPSSARSSGRFGAGGTQAHDRRAWSQ